LPTCVAKDDEDLLADSTDTGVHLCVAGTVGTQKPRAICYDTVGQRKAMKVERVMGIEPMKHPSAISRLRYWRRPSVMGVRNLEVPGALRGNVRQ
jgi:hypothetical protein